MTPSALLSVPRLAGLVVSTDSFLLPGPAVAEWVLLRGSDGVAGIPGEQFFTSLEAAARALGPDEPFVLGLPLELALVQRLRLPAAEGEELFEMARIQIEKILPYSGDSLALDCQIIEQSAQETVLAAYAVHNDRLLALCEPLAAMKRWPRQVTLAVLVKAAVAASTHTGNALLLYREAGRAVAGIVEGGHLCFAQLLPLDTAPEAELPSLLLGAELEGVPANFERLQLDPNCAEWGRQLHGALGLEIEPLAALPPEGTKIPGDLSPAGWRAARRARVRSGLLRRRILIGLAIYIGLLLLGLADLARLYFERSWLSSRLEAAEPRIDEIESAQRRWHALAPAVNWHLSVVELLNQVRQCLPPGDLRITVFELSRLRSPAVMTLEGEAPSYELAVEVGEKLKARPEFAGFTFTTETPVILSPSNRAHFRVSATLP